MKRIYTLLSNTRMKQVLAAIVLFLAIESYSQEKQDSAFGSLRAEWNNFNFSAPDTSFLPVDGGLAYFNKTYNSRIKYGLLPGDYSSNLNQFRKIESTAGSMFLDTISHSQRKAFSILREEIAPAGSGYENYISVLTIVEHSNQITLMVAGAYPKSQDAHLRKKFLDSSLSIRRKQ